MRIIKTIIHGLAVVGRLFVALVMVCAGLIIDVTYLVSGMIRYWLLRFEAWVLKTMHVNESDAQRWNRHIDGVSNWDHAWAERLHKLRFN